MKNRLWRVVAVALMLTLFATSAAFAVVPSDVQGKDYEGAVAELMDKGIITGDSDGLYHPDKNLTRAEACSLVVKAMNPPSIEVVGTPTQKVSKSGFSDMAGAGWAEGYVGYAVKHNITNGIGDNKFAPSANVTPQEFVTMVLRASGYTDQVMTGAWPDNYMNKAEEIGLFEGIGDPTDFPGQATKALAAQLLMNGLSKIEAAQKNNSDADSDNMNGFIPGSSKVVFGTGSFNENMTTYGGKSISSDVVVYTYGEQKDYSADMKLPTDKNEYMLSTVYRFKMAETPCFYAMENGKITAMILPEDSGFSGNAYGVINSIDAVTNGKKEKVKEINSLVAGKKIGWLTKSESVTGLPDSEADYLNGEVYQMTIQNGEVKKMYKVSDSGHNKNFSELTKASSSNNPWVTVESISDKVAKMSDGTYITIAENAVIYVISDGDTEYKTGTVNTIKSGAEIRAYSITDKESVASIVTVRK